MRTMTEREGSAFAAAQEDLTCQFPACLKPGTWRRQNTNYDDDAENFACYCEMHQQEVDYLWNETWKESAS